MSSIFQQVFQAQSAFQAALLTLPNVVGVAVGYKESNGVITDQPAMVVLVQQKKPLAALAEGEIIPRELNGIPVDVYEVGYIQAHQQNPRDRFRPVIPGGVSIGHYKVTAGTLGAVVRDRTTGERLILSNNHVLANSNEAEVGDPILQPADTDGGKNPGDIVARLERFIALNYLEEAPSPPPSPPTEPEPMGCLSLLVSLSNLLAGVSGSQQRVQVAPVAATTPPVAAQVRENLADCALARPQDPQMFSDQILNIGAVRHTMAPALGMRIRKSGRTTGLTESMVTLLNATVNVAYNTSRGMRTARFTGQCICEPMSQGGDSGAIIVDVAEPRAVGLLFAGSPLATIFTPIDTVLTALNVTFE